MQEDDGDAMSEARRTSARNVCSRVLEEVPELLARLLAHLPTPELLRLQAVDKRWATAAECVLQSLCQDANHQLPRRPRNLAPVARLLPWRTLWLTKHCRACFAAPADFVVRQGPHGATLFGLCSKCCKSPRVRSLLKGEALCLDLIGVSGKHLPEAKDIHDACRKRQLKSYRVRRTT